MVTHYIFISSSYSNRTRIAYDICKLDGVTSEVIANVSKTVQEKCGQDVALGFQCIQVQSEKWEDVVKYDPFFDNMLVIPTLEEFINLINADRDLGAIDVAYYILTRLKCSHIRLQKLLYFCYADYLCNTGKKLFEDKIYAYKYGPIVKSVHDDFIEQYHVKNDEDIKLPFDKARRAANRSFLLFVKDGTEKTYSVEKTLERYKHYNAKSLMAITHRKGSPWDKTELGFEISDYDIIESHFIESKDKTVTPKTN